MKKLAACLLLFVTPLTYAEDSCFPEPVKPDVLLASGGGLGGKSLMHVLEIDGCWLRGKQCRKDGQGALECQDAEYWVHLNMLSPFNIEQL